jgi:hypothetical protein
MWTIADVAVGPTILFGGLTLGVIVFIPILIIEALVLWRLRWGSFGRSLIDALIANVASTIFGLVFFALFFTTAFQCTRVPAGDGVHSVQSCGWTISPALWFIAQAALSILIEGGVLLLLKRHPPRKTWIAAIAANVASYVLLGLLALAGALSLS